MDPDKIHQTIVNSISDSKTVLMDEKSINNYIMIHNSPSNNDFGGIDFLVKFKLILRKLYVNGNLK